MLELASGTFGAPDGLCWDYLVERDVPFAAGGSFDVIGRIFAACMSEILGQQVLVENISGAAGIIGLNRVVNAAPDGYTLLFGSIGTHAYNQTIYKKPRYDAIADFTSVALLLNNPWC